MIKKFIFLGTGTSNGIPFIGWKCKTCRNCPKEFEKTRTSGFIEFSNGTNILIDFGPDIRKQILNNNIKKIDLILLTHSHADHISGIHDLLPFCKEKPLLIYGIESQIEELIERFPNFFNLIKPKFLCKIINSKFEFNNIEIIPIPILHGKLKIFGYKINDFSYITDAKFFPPESIQLLENTKILILNTLNNTEHNTHLTYDESFEISLQIKPKIVYLVHVSDSMSHESIQNYFNNLKKNINSKINFIVSYDGLIINEIDLNN